MQTIGMIRTLLSENNYKSEDIDRVVFIGGPDHAFRLSVRRSSSELGIAADLKTDPMTAVAIGAAYYAESRQWDAQNNSAPKPKKPPHPCRRNRASPSSTPRARRRIKRPSR